MTAISPGDIARSLQMRRQTAELKTALAQHSRELTTGRNADPARSLRGDVSTLAALERDRAAIAAHQTATTEAALHTAAQQSVLTQLTEDAATVSGRFLGLGPGLPGSVLDAVAGIGRTAFDNAVSALNTRVADRSIFAGVTSDSPALAPPEEILQALRAEIAGLTDPAAIEAAVIDWFATPGGGFDSTALQGSATPAGPTAIAPGESVPFTVTAARAELRPTLAGFALSALVAEGPPGASSAQRVDLLQRAGLMLNQGQADLPALSGELGVTESRIAAAQARNAAEDNALTLALDGLIGVDPYEAAARLEDTRLRIEALYTVTARLQRLTLTEFLR